MTVVKIVPMPGVPGPAGSTGEPGPQGPQGQTGPQGPPGQSATFPTANSFSAQVTGSGYSQTSSTSLGLYYNYGKIIFIHAELNFTNVTSFGTGILSMNLPFVSVREADVFGGTLHDVSTGENYSIKGHCEAGDSKIELWHISGTGKDQPVTATAPIPLTTSDKIHISFWYETI
jgi:hypothetical protein